jgi:hypothetical protein
MRRHGRIGVPGAGPADAAEAAATRRNLRVEDAGDPGPETQVGGAHDAGGHPRRTVEAGGAHRGDAVHELGLADGAQGLRATRLEHGPALDEDGAHDVVAGVRVDQDLVEQVARDEPGDL